MVMNRILVLCFLTVTVTVLADDNAVEKYRNYTPHQIAEMSEELRKNELPVMYTYAAQNGLSKGSETLFAMWLNTLMYSGVQDYDAAVKQFQEDLGDKPNGILTVWQIHNLEKCAGTQNLANVFFPDQFYSRKTDTYATVTGTFVILDEKIAYPINYAEVTCYKSDGYCKVEQLFLTIPKDDAWSQNYHVRQFDPEYYNITSWTKDAVDAVPDESSTACRTTTMNLNFATEEFYQITRNTGRECDVLGTAMPKLERPRVSQIVDGEKIIAQEFADVQKAALDVLSSDFRSRIEKLLAEENND